MKLNLNWTSVLHHTNFGGCERLALDFLRDIKSDLIVFHRQSEVVNSAFHEIPNTKMFVNRISIRNPLSIIRARKFENIGEHSSRCFILWHGRYSLLATLLSLYQRNARFIVHIGTNIDEVNVAERISMRILNKLFGKQIKFICVSQFTRGTLLTKFPYLTDKTDVIPNGISTRVTKAYTTYSNHKFVMVSRFDNSKKQELIIDAFLTGKIEGKVLFVGDGENLLKCKEICESSQYSDRFTFTGNLQEPFSYLDSNQLFIFAADNREGFGLVIYEAIVSGLRVIASDIPAVREIIKDERFLFFNNKNSLLETLVYAEQNKVRHFKYMNSLQVKIEKQYSLAEMHQKYLDLW